MKEAPSDELCWVTEVLSRIADEIGFELCRRMTKLPPLGFYQPVESERRMQVSDPYTFSDPVSGMKETFVPVRYVETV